MSLKVFEYHRKDLKFLRKSLTFRTIFSLLFFMIFVWQFGSSNNQRHNNVTITISDIKICYKNAEYDGE